MKHLPSCRVNSHERLVMVANGQLQFIIYTFSLSSSSFSPADCNLGGVPPFQKEPFVAWAPPSLDHVGIDQWHTKWRLDQQNKPLNFELRVINLIVPLKRLGDLNSVPTDANMTILSISMHVWLCIYIYTPSCLNDLFRPNKKNNILRGAVGVINGYITLLLGAPGAPCQWYVKAQQALSSIPMANFGLALGINGDVKSSVHDWLAWLAFLFG